MSYDQPQSDVTTGYFGEHGSMWLRPSDPEFRADKFHRHRVGLCEIAFSADSRQQIDDLAKQISANGGKVTDLPKEYDYLPGYYAGFFTDPDGMKLGLVHVPRLRNDLRRRWVWLSEHLFELVDDALRERMVRR